MIFGACLGKECHLFLFDCWGWMELLWIVFLQLLTNRNSIPLANELSKIGIQCLMREAAQCQSGYLPEYLPIVSEEFESIADPEK